MVKQASLPIEKKCSLCGHTVYITADICPNCGSYQNPLRSASPGISGRRLKAVLLAFFLGSVGAHKFYLGRTAQGLIFLLFCWTFIPAIAGIIESVNYLSLSDEAFEAKYGLFSPKPTLIRIPPLLRKQNPTK